MAGKNNPDLILLLKAAELVEAVNRATEAFPEKETFGLASQMRRAAVSIAVNIVRGRRRRSPLRFDRVLRVAYGWVREIETQVLIAKRLQHLDSTIKSQLMERTAELGRLLDERMRSLSGDQ